MAFEPQVGEDEGIDGLCESIYGLHYGNVMDIDHLLNYPSENDIVMELPIDEEIIQGVINTPIDDHDPDDIGVLPSVTSKEAFQAVVTWNNFLLQNEKKIPNKVYDL